MQDESDDTALRAERALPRNLGWMRGQFSVGEEIFEPLSEEELRRWEGE